MTIDTSDKSGGWSPVLRDFNVKVRQLQKQGYYLSGLRRTQQRNRDVGGDPMSQHQIGTAADFVRLQDQQAFLAFQAAARSMRLQVVDERRLPPCPQPPGVRCGPHVHVQAYRAGRAPLAMYQAAGIPLPAPPSLSRGVQISEVP